MAAIQNRISEHRRAKGLSQHQLAELVGAHWVTISKLERGKIKLNSEWAERLAAALNISAFEIFGHHVPVDTATVYARTDESGRIIDNVGDMPIDDLTFELSPTYIDNASWCEICTTIFQPIAFPGDMARILVSRSDIDPEILLDRLVVVEYVDDGSIVETLAILGRGKDPGHFDLKNMAGAFRRNVEVKAFGIVGAIISQPRRTAEFLGEGVFVRVSMSE